MITFCKFILIILGPISLAYTQTSWEGRGTGAFTREKLKLNAPFLEKYIVTSFKENNEFFELWSKKQDRNVFMEIHKHSPSLDEFDNFKKSNLIIVRNLYRATPSPYPGSISKDQECGDQKNRPLEYEVKSKNMVFFVFEGAASSRFVLGVCDSKEIAYQGAIVLFKTDHYYGLMRVFVPLHEFDKNKEFVKNSLLSLTYFSRSLLPNQ